MRVQPTPAVGIAIGLGYIPLFIGGSALLGGSMANMSTPAGILPFVGALAVGVVVLAALTTWLGWWPAVLRDPTALAAARPAPWLMAAGIAAGAVIGAPWGQAGDLLAITAVLAVLVGIGEELAYRGLVLTGMRGAWTEGRMFLVMTFLFAILHLPNMLLGVPAVSVVVQTFLAFLGGTALYLARRASGGLWVPVVLHGAWDFVTFTTTNPVSTMVQLLASIVIFVWFLAARKRLLVAADPSFG